MATDVEKGSRTRKTSNDVVSPELNRIAIRIATELGLVTRSQHDDLVSIASNVSFRDLIESISDQSTGTRAARIEKLVNGHT